MAEQPIQPKTALILGATGGAGGAVTEALLAQGWRIAALTRDPARAAEGRDSRIKWTKGDAMDADAMRRAAMGSALIVHAVNPPGYRDWDKLVLPMIDNTIAAARAAGARVLLPGTVYNYGPDAFPVLSEDKLQRPITRKGAIRVAMEQRLKDSGVPTLVVRAGDFFGGRHGGNNWFVQGLVKPHAPLKAVSNPSWRGVGHAWAYLPDLAQTMVQLVERTPAVGFETYHFAGHYDSDGTQMAAAICLAAGRRIPIRAFPWFVVPLAAPFVTTFREMLEMRYLWRETLRLDNAKLVRTLGAEPHTPLNQAVKTTLGELGCL
jgi:nucleoside-diphosphate-sugar epimerase